MNFFKRSYNMRLFILLGLINLVYCLTAFQRIFGMFGIGNSPSGTDNDSGNSFPSYIANDCEMCSSKLSYASLNRKKIQSETPISLNGEQLRFENLYNANEVTFELYKSYLDEVLAHYIAYSKSKKDWGTVSLSEVEYRQFLCKSCCENLEKLIKKVWRQFIAQCNSENDPLSYDILHVLKYIFQFYSCDRCIYKKTFDDQEPGLDLLSNCKAIVECFLKIERMPMVEEAFKEKIARVRIYLAHTFERGLENLLSPLRVN